MNRLSVRLFLWFCAANLLTLVITVVVTERIERDAYQVLQPDWQAVARDAAAVYDRGNPNEMAAWVRSLDLRGVDVALFSGEEPVLNRRLSSTLAAHKAELLAADDAVSHPAADLTLVAERVNRPGKPPFHFLASRGPRVSDARLWLPLAVQIVVSALMIGAFGWGVARRILGPLLAVQTAARHLAQGELETRVGGEAAQGGDEVGQLARDFNAMAERIQASVEQTRGLLQDVSHELRSPLARLHLVLELAASSDAEERRTHLEKAQLEIERVDRVISQVLALARLDAQVPGAAHETVPLAQLVEECRREAREAAAARRIDLVGDIAPLTVVGDRALLARALDNLLGNAIKFSPAGKPVELEARRENGHAVIAVRDRGPGVPEGELDKIFRPFFRGANAAVADGQGLGLPIVDRIARAHGGSVKAANRAGGGLEQTLTLPLDPAA